jgi:hypothetical protein
MAVSAGQSSGVSVKSYCCGFCLLFSPEKEESGKARADGVLLQWNLLFDTLTSE